ncbi:HEPN domain-containing protein [Phenylobacterium sp. LH3H17]|uniref:HEPN domain-containing protein n=1 Tax=Phenylobacterium sp. LH3H17 TaxID=2903901 RepID=UPI0020C96AF0|nr:HEPN domain-containing protein [Phenylobacterium sp. LH3H17]UTP38171.1 HEPN domain-containing protein [Phenylobacterium sp. LH3H17]
MRTDLDHLPDAKRRELVRVVQILFEEFEAATETKSHAHRRNGQILKIILYGSHARGDWVADPVGGYFSDYDLLVVVDHEDLTDVQDYWAKADERLTREVTIARRLSAPVNFIVHSLADVNKKLRLGRYFFIDILRDGIALYEAQGHPFDTPEKLSPEAALAEAQGYFDEWSQTAAQFVRQAQHAVEDGAPKIAAFDLHQATERFYACALLVLTLYSPKSHKLNFLRSQAEQLVPELSEAWPRDNKFGQRCFELLRRAYVDARYSPHYKISAEELGWLSERVAILQGLVLSTSEERLAALRAAA